MQIIVAVLLVLAGSAQNKPAGSKTVPAALNFTMNSINGTPTDLAKYQGKVVLMVNVASECGYTPQYAGLQELHEKYAAKGLSILGFPANDFGAQEPGTNTEIAEFCKKNYGVEFDMFSKIVVKGSGKAPRKVPDRAERRNHSPVQVGCGTAFTPDRRCNRERVNAEIGNQTSSYDVPSWRLLRKQKTASRS
jgi:hypothetical protein